MADWVEYAKIIGGLVGAIGISSLAKLYHDKVIAGKEIELKNKDAELARIRAELTRAESRAKNAEDATSPGQRDLGKLREQLTEMVERLAKTLNAQAATLYVPLFTAGDQEAEFPRGYAFVAVYNIDPDASAAILRMKLVESWTIVGECWAKGMMMEDNALQANVRHMASYDAQSGFVPVHTLVAPVRWQNRQVGVIQFFNKTQPGNPHDIALNGFGSEDRKQLVELLQDTSDASFAAKTYYFQSNAEYVRLLGLQGEINLENAAILCVDLTRSSSLFRELPLIDAARLINRFNENVYQRMGRYAAVVEKFNGDGTLTRFHYGGFDTLKPASNPAFRAVCAATDLLGDFRDFKAKHWKQLSSEAANTIKLRVTIALGPVLSTNVGPRQFQVPTVMGQCVNRSAKMVGYAPRDRDVLLVDDNVRKALMQIERDYGRALTAFQHWNDAGGTTAASMAGHSYFEVDCEPFKRAAAELCQNSGR